MFTHVLRRVVSVVRCCRAIRYTFWVRTVSREWLGPEFLRLCGHLKVFTQCTQLYQTGEYLRKTKHFHPPWGR